jgi:tetratricopeptide (TPR) repeat protein
MRGRRQPLPAPDKEESMKKIVLCTIAALVLAAVGCEKDQPKQQVTYMPPSPPMASQIDQLQQAAKASPKSADAWIRLGDALMDSQRFSEAIEAYDKSLALDPKNINVLVDQGTCYRGVGKFEKALEQYRKALKINPSFPNAHRNMGVVLGFDLGKKDEALKSFKKYLEIVPTGPDADNIRKAIAELSAK